MSTTGCKRIHESLDLNKYIAPPPPPPLKPETIIPDETCSYPDAYSPNILKNFHRPVPQILLYLVYSEAF